MTHRERLLAALALGEPDCAPVTWELVGRFAQALTGRSDWRAMVDAHREIGSAVFNLQGVGPHLNSRLPAGYESCGERHAQPDGSFRHVRTLSTPKGALEERRLSNFVPHDPLLGKTVEYMVKDRRDYDVLEDFILRSAEAAEPDASQSIEAREYVGEDGLVGFWMGDPLYHVSHSRRDTEFIMDLVEDPARMGRLFEAAEVHSERCVEAFNASAADVLVYDVCWGSTSLLNPQMIQEFILPPARRLAERVSSDKIWGFFTTGKIRAALPWLADCGPAFIQHFDVLGDCDLAEVKHTFGRRVCIVGNYSPVVLARGSLDDARGEARRCLDAAMAGGGYIMSTSDEVPADAKPDNMKAVVEYVEEHGRY